MPEKIPSGEALPKAFEKEREIGVVPLVKFKGSSLHNELALTDHPQYLHLTRERGIVVDDLALFPDEEKTIFVRHSLDTISSHDDLTSLAEQWNLGPQDYVGYGIGIGQVGFTVLSRIIDKINENNFDSAKLNIYLPFALEAKLK